MNIGIDENNIENISQATKGFTEAETVFMLALTSSEHEEKQAPTPKERAGDRKDPPNETTTIATDEQPSKQGKYTREKNNKETAEILRETIQKIDNGELDGIKNPDEYINELLKINGIDSKLTDIENLINAGTKHTEILARHANNLDPIQEDKKPSSKFTDVAKSSNTKRFVELHESRRTTFLKSSSSTEYYR